ncbi:MAG: sugar transferase [Solirubrobacteraceae bacterium]
MAKRLVDVILALVVLLATLPLMALAALAVWLDTPGPVLFRQERLGKYRRPFKVLKFRTMHNGVSSDAHRAYIAQLAAAEQNGDGSRLRKLTGDVRVTRTGRLLRALSIDELPQLFNVLAGDMSIVGPRPALEYELEHYSAGDFDRFAVRPGLTGLWQVSGRSELGLREMLALDAEYARDCSLRRDALILLKTPAALVHRRTA